MRGTSLWIIAAALTLAACVSTSEQPDVAVRVSGAPGPQATTTSDGGELWLIPSPVDGLLMRATLYRPAGAGPFPLAIINHGSEQDANARASAPLPTFPAATAWFLARGYAVLIPERPGHGKTGGRYLEDQGPCDAADYVAAGNGAADSIAAVLTYMHVAASIRPTGVVLVGNSAGAWGALALAARKPAGVRAVIGFAAGRGGHNGGRPLSNCSPDRLVAAAGTFGKTSRLPTLLLYAANDTYFPPDLSGRIADAYRQAGGNVEYRLLPAISGEGHGLIADQAAWAPTVDAFLKAH
ncbi:MAG TPA: CocE/NonD family hydrolase [Bauldia sp.]|nr:CocE/NonD family hydrolase [Bauldia sp.]